MTYRFEDCELDPVRRQLLRRGQLIAVEPQVFDLLCFLVENRERVVSRDDIIAAVWGGRIISESAISTRINAVRGAIGDSGEAQRLIKTFPRKGIRFIAEVQLSEQAIPPASIQATTVQTTSSADMVPSVAVMPFNNLSGDPEQDYFADGMAEEIITALSRCSALTVIARNSSFTYKSKTVDVRQVGRELSVRYVIEGSVRRAGTRLRIATQLVDASTAAHIWTERFDGAFDEVFELQDRIAESIVAAIEPSLLLAEINRTRRKGVDNLDAYDLLLRAQQHMHEFTPESMSAALASLGKALEIDPNYAPALALNAYCRAQCAFQGWWSEPGTNRAEGVRQAIRAVELAKDDAVVLCMAAYAVRELGQDTLRCKELVSRALQLNPSSFLALTIAGWNEIVVGIPSHALELLGRAERLNPRDPRAWFLHNAAALAHLALGEYDQAVARARRSLAQNPRSGQALRFLASSLAHMGLQQAAEDAMLEALRLEPQLTIRSLRARLAFMPDSIWERLSAGYRIAGMPEGLK